MFEENETPPHSSNKTLNRDFKYSRKIADMKRKYLQWIVILVGLCLVSYVVRIKPSIFGHISLMITNQLSARRDATDQNISYMRELSLRNEIGRAGSDEIGLVTQTDITDELKEFDIKSKHKVSSSTAPSTVKPNTKLREATSYSSTTSFSTRPPQRAEIVKDCQKLRFRKDNGFPKTAVASVPGSGNTWARHLIQQLTGYYTGSVYYDGTLAENGFPGEYTTDGTVIAIKTHRHYDLDKYKKAIIVMRNPYDAIKAEFNRRKAHSHTKAIRVTAYKTSAWRTAVKELSDKWYQFHKSWLGFKGPLLIVQYERLKTNLEDELINIAKFLNQNIDKQILNCVLSHSRGTFKRKHKGNETDPFTPGMKKEIDNKLKKINRLILTLNEKEKY